jgi:rhodanese-related sulfurtransferase
VDIFLVVTTRYTSTYAVVFSGLQPEIMEYEVAGLIMTNEIGYAGDVSPDKTWQHLSSDETAVLVDVRTKPEWAFVGIPDLANIGKTPVLLEWQVFPDMCVNDNFQANLTLALKENGLGQDANIFMLCRSGVRSRSAAQLMTAAGYPHCYNVVTGFEGDLDETGKRGRVAGWKADGLPWRQG